MTRNKENIEIDSNTGRPRSRRLSTAQINQNLHVMELAALSHGSIIDLTDDGPAPPPPPVKKRKTKTKKEIKRLGILQPRKKK